MSGSSAGFDSSPSSSTDSTSPGPSFSDKQWKRDLSSNLKLGLSISCPSCDISTKPSNWNEEDDQHPGRPSFLFVKVYMEGMPIGRKLDLYALRSYDDLLETLSNMFGISIYSTRLAEMENSCRAHLFGYSVLIYKDTEGDWMMVGDVPWELFLTTVKRLKITNPYGWSRHTHDRIDIS